MRVLGVLAVTAAAALAAVGCVLAIVFELDGFGRPRDAEPRPGYLLLLGLGLVASVGVPAVLWRLLLRGRARGWTILALPALAVVLVLVLLGVSLR